MELMQSTVRDMERDVFRAARVPVTTNDIRPVYYGGHDLFTRVEFVDAGNVERTERIVRAAGYKVHT